MEEAESVDAKLISRLCIKEHQDVYAGVEGRREGMNDEGHGE